MDDCDQGAALAGTECIIEIGVFEAVRRACLLAMLTQTRSSPASLLFFCRVGVYSGHLIARSYNKGILRAAGGSLYRRSARGSGATCQRQSISFLIEADTLITPDNLPGDPLDGIEPLRAHNGHEQRTEYLHEQNSKHIMKEP